MAESAADLTLPRDFSLSGFTGPAALADMQQGLMMYRPAEYLRMLHPYSACAISTHGVSCEATAGALRNGAIVRVDIGHHFTRHEAFKIAGVTELEYMDPLCTVFESGSITILSWVPCANAPSIV